MLRKLFKYEFKYYLKVQFLAFLALIGTNLLARLFLEFADYLTYNTENPILASLVSAPAVIFVIAAAVVTAAVLLLPTILGTVSFYKKLIGNEGYLSFTLPVKPWHHIFVKLVTSLIWTIISAIEIVLVVPACYLIANPGIESLRQLFDETLSIFRSLECSGFQWIALLVIVVITLIVSHALKMMTIFMSISIGQLFNKQKLIGSIGMYFGVNIALSAVSSMLVPFMTLFAVDDMDNMSLIINRFIGIMSLNAVFSAVVTVVMFLISKWLLTSKLNLE